MKTGTATLKAIIDAGIGSTNSLLHLMAVDEINGGTNRQIADHLKMVSIGQISSNLKQFEKRGIVTSHKVKVKKHTAGRQWINRYEVTTLGSDILTHFLGLRNQH